jgi:hypothetical protein
VWRNIAVWNLSTEVDLLGPAEWWPEDYDYQAYGFEVPEIDNGHEEAFEMLFHNEVPAKYNLIFPSNDDLRVMKDTPEARFIQRSMA